MRIAEKIRSIFKRSKSHQIETIIISEKQCPHCASRGMFVFNDNSKISKTINVVESKDQCHPEPVEG
jgi:hypothetical protein